MTSNVVLIRICCEIREYNTCYVRISLFMSGQDSGFFTGSSMLTPLWQQLNSIWGNIKVKQKRRKVQWPSKDGYVAHTSHVVSCISTAYHWCKNP